MSVKPWATVIIDDVEIGETPMAKPIILRFGEHDVELKNTRLSHVEAKDQSHTAESTLRNKHRSWREGGFERTVGGLSRYA